jgi:hypothetical protein
LEIQKYFYFLPQIFEDLEVLLLLTADLLAIWNTVLLLNTVQTFQSLPTPAGCQEQTEQRRELGVQNCQKVGGQGKSTIFISIVQLSVRPYLLLACEAEAETAHIGLAFFFSIFK